MSKNEMDETGERTPELASGLTEDASAVPEAESPPAELLEETETASVGAKEESESVGCNPETDTSEADTQIDQAQHSSNPSDPNAEECAKPAETVSFLSKASSTRPETGSQPAEMLEGAETVSAGVKEGSESVGCDPETDPSEANAQMDQTQRSLTPAVVANQTMSKIGEQTPELVSCPSEDASAVPETESPPAGLLEETESASLRAKEEIVSASCDPETEPGEANTQINQTEQSSSPSGPNAEECATSAEKVFFSSKAVSATPETGSQPAVLPEGTKKDSVWANEDVVSDVADRERVPNEANVQADQERHSSIPANVEKQTVVRRPGGVHPIPALAASHRATEVTPIETLKKTVHLKNARVNEPYSGEVEMTGIRGVRLVEGQDTGLIFDSETATLSGTPVKSGDFTFRFQGLLDGRRCDVTANLAVIPNPRSLWVAKDSDRTAPYWKEDEDHDLLQGDLLCVAVSKRGRSHAQEGLFRDDDFSLWTGEPEGWNIAAVADGAGSAKFSRRGSRIAVRTITKALPKLLDEHLSGQIDGLISEWRNGDEGAEARIRIQLYHALATAAFSAAKAISEEAHGIGERSSAFSTTLVMSVARRGPHGWFIAGFSIGDGGAAIFDLPSRTVVPLTLADSGEFAGQTRFLQTSEFSDGAAMKRIFFDVREKFTAILTMTDGITDPKFPTDTAFENPDNWIRFWEGDLSQGVNLRRDNPELEQELLAWLDFWSPGNHDDRTLAIMLP